MNKDTRTDLNSIGALLRQLKHNIQDIFDSEEEVYGNMTEAWRESEEGEKLMQQLNTLEKCTERLDDIEFDLMSIIIQG